MTACTAGRRLALQTKNVKHSIRRNGDMLPSVDCERNGIRSNRPTSLEIPQRLAGLRIQSEEITFVRPAEHQSARG